MMPYIPLSIHPFLETCREEPCPDGWACWSAGLVDCVSSDFAMKATRYSLGRLYDVCCTQQSLADLRQLVHTASNEQKAYWQTLVGGLIIVPSLGCNPLFQTSLNKFVYNVRHSTDDLTIEQLHTMLLFIRVNFTEYLRALSWYTPQPGITYRG